MIKNIKFLFFVTIIDIGIFYGWASVLYAFSPLRLLLTPLFLILPKDIASSTNFQGNILPLFIFPIIFVINFIAVKKFGLDVGHTMLDWLFTHLFLPIIPILLTLTIIFGPTIINEKLHEESVVRNFTVTSKPTFVLQVGATPGFFNFIMRLPVRIKTTFNGAWIGNFYDSRFSPSNGQALSNISGCNLGTHFLDSIQPPTVGGKNLPGDYTFSFQYNFHGSSCTEEVFKSLIGKEIELLQTTNKEIKILKNFTVDYYKTEVYK